MRRIVRLFLLYCLIGVIIFVIANSLFGNWQFKTQSHLLRIVSANILYSLVLGGLNILYFKWIDGIQWKEHYFTKRIVFGILGSVPVTIVGLFLLKLGFALFMNQVTFEYFINHQGVKGYMFGVWMSLFVVITFHAFYFFKEIQDRKVKDSQMVAKTESAKFESLKNQLDPHFLFNSLNVLSSLIEENPKHAEKFTAGLSKVYRYILEQKDKDLVLVSQEIKFAKIYMDLLKTRFEDGIDFEIVEEFIASELKIIPLSLQLLLENTVKHNVIISEEPLRIRIYQKGDHLVVENNYKPKEVIEKSTKVGLNNIKQRYQLITDKKVNVEQINSVFRVTIPMLTKISKTMKTDYITEGEKYARAQKRVEDIRNFYFGLASYILVMPFLIYINYTTNWRHQWFWYPLFGWGFGTLMNAIRVFGFPRSWEEKKIKAYMEEDNF